MLFTVLKNTAFGRVAARAKKESGIDIVKVAEELYKPRTKTASDLLTPSVPSFNRDDRSWGQAGLETGAALGAGYGLGNFVQSRYNSNHYNPFVTHADEATLNKIQTMAGGPRARI